MRNSAVAINRIKIQRPLGAELNSVLNSQLVTGQVSLARQHQQNWGAKIIDHLSEDIKEAFLEMSGFSPRNLNYMRNFAKA